MSTSHLDSNETKLSEDRNLRHTEVWEHIQRGLVYPSPNAIFASFWVEEGQSVSRSNLRDLKLKLRSHIHTTEILKHSSTTAVLAAGINFWTNLCKKEEMSLPKGMKFKYPDESGNSSTVVTRSSNSFKNNDADLWFHIKSDDMTACIHVLKFIMRTLGKKVKAPIYQYA